MLLIILKSSLEQFVINLITITGMSSRYCEKIISTLLKAKLIDPIPLKFGFRNSVYHLIIIVDYTSEAEEITKWIQDFNRADEQPKVSRDNKTPKHLFTIKGINDIYYLLRSDLENGTPERLFSITGYKEYKNDKGVLVSSGKCMLFNLISENNPCLKRNN